MCAQVVNQRWKDTLQLLKQVNASPERAVEEVSDEELTKA